MPVRNAFTDRPETRFQDRTGFDPTAQLRIGSPFAAVRPEAGFIGRFALSPRRNFFWLRPAFL
jgi:hypothetical protein